MNNQKIIIQKVVVGGVLILDGKVLIVQRHDNEMIYPGMWELPSGKKELLEPTEKALVREFFEETGISVKIIIPVSVFDYQTEKQIESGGKMKKKQVIHIEASAAAARRSGHGLGKKLTKCGMIVDQIHINDWVPNITCKRCVKILLAGQN